MGQIKCSHPRIWNFLSILNEIITDTNLEIVRCLQGLEITRSRKKKNVLHEKRRALFKEKLISGCYSPMQYLKSIGCTIGNDNYVEELDLSYLSDSESSH